LLTELVWIGHTAEARRRRKGRIEALQAKLSEWNSPGNTACFLVEHYGERRTENAPHVRSIAVNASRERETMNPVYKEMIDAFLRLERIAILGYSADKNQPANHIYRKLVANGYAVFAVNPKADRITDVRCYASIQSVPEQIQGAVLCTPTHATEGAVRECADNGVQHVWMHKGLGAGSYDPQAFETAKALGLAVIPGGCPMMFVKPDIIHRCVGWLQELPE
jgi:predicted CoA-binding protein